jgi:hypothetical protein
MAERRKGPQMATASKEARSVPTLPQELEQFIDSSVDAMDENALNHLEQESKKLLDEAKRSDVQRGTRRETA